MKNNKTLKKFATGFVAFNVIASSLLTTLPIVSSAMELPEESVSSSIYNAGTLNNAQFDTLQGWTAYATNGSGIQEYRVFSAGDVVSNIGSTSVLANGLGLTITTDQNQKIQEVFQVVNTTPGHTYTLKVTLKGTAPKQLNPQQYSAQAAGPVIYNGSSPGSASNIISASTYSMEMGSGIITYTFIASSDKTTISLKGGAPAQASTRDAIYSGLSLVDSVPFNPSQAFASTSINKVSDMDSIVNGSGEPGATITIKKGSIILGTGIIDNTGNYSVEIPPQLAGTTLLGTAIKNGVGSDASTVVIESRIPSAPTIQPVSDLTTLVKGSGVAGDKITLTNGADTWIGTVDATGNYAISIPRQLAGTKLEATATNPANGKVSPKASVTVADTTLSKPTISPVTAGNTTVTVTGQAGATINFTDASGTVSKVADANGKATFNIPAAKINDEYKATQTGANGKASAADTYKVKDSSTPAAPTVNPIKDTDTKATGKGEPNSDVEVKIGDKTYNGTTDGNGDFSIEIPKQNGGTKVDVIIINPNNGNESTPKEITVTDTTLAKPTISPVAIGDNKVTVTGTAGASITLTTPDGDTITKTADATGKAIFTVDPAKINNEFKATQTGANGKASPAATYTVKDSSTPAAPTVNPIKDTDTKATGKGEPNSDVGVKIGDNTYTGKTDANGDFSIEIPKQNGGTEVEVTQTNPNNGNVSPAKDVIVTDTTLEVPAITPVKAGDSKVVVTGDPGATITLTTPDGDKTSKVADATGKATFTVDPAKAGDTYIATQTGANGKASAPATANATAVTTAGTITATDFILGTDKSITGTFTGDVKSFRVTIGTKVYTGGTINAATGTYSFYALDKATAVGQFKVEGLDASGKVLDTKTANIKTSNTPNPPGTGTITAATFTIHKDKSVTGTFTGDVKTLSLTYDGKEYKGGTVNADGTYSFYALSVITDKTKAANINGFDQYGNKIATSAITLLDANDSQIGTGTVTANDFNLGLDKNITGTFTGDVKSLKVTVGDTVYSGGTLNADGTYSFYGWDKIINTTAAVKVDGYDKNGNKIATTSVTVKKPSTTGTITPATYNLPADKTLTATYTGDVKTVKVVINGTTYTGGTVANGTVSFYIGNKITSKDDVVKIYAYDAYGTELSNKTVTINSTTSITSGTITPAEYTVGTTNLTADYTGDVKSVKVNINGTDYTGGTFTDGKLTFYIGGKIKSSTDAVTVTAFDAAGKQLDQETVTVKAAATSTTSGTITPAVYLAPGTTYLTADYTGDVKSVKVNINGTDYTGGTFTDGKLNFYIGDKIKSSADVVTVTAFDAVGKQLAKKTLTINDRTAESGTITPAAFSLKTSILSGTYTGTAKSLRITVNGTALAAGGTVASGNFSYYVGLKNKITSKDDVVKVALLDAYGLVMDEKTVTIND
ncbi:hypothetical protein BMT55_12825 [Listeria newyorkensis]|uniref:Uncharacterized protein n=1 Tax=Listeria newyorkensis TaxID=1497681 RepID=A0ABX4XLV5_9LIST|nr:immunoglobulin-like domain-containing protein [Listeria newyorkensis]PNP89376.1 hypothetical protein BMT55_12825 [Listeria newyorkensis]